MALAGGEWILVVFVYFTPDSCQLVLYVLPHLCRNISLELGLDKEGWAPRPTNVRGQRGE